MRKRFFVGRNDAPTDRLVVNTFNEKRRQFRQTSHRASFPLDRDLPSNRSGIVTGNARPGLPGDVDLPESW
jgi:hypothetical protein